MEAAFTAVEQALDINDSELLTDLEKLTDAELAQIGGGQGIVVF